jgi:signal transduction histidine kinase
MRAATTSAAMDPVANSAVNSGSADADGEYQRLMGEIFHDLGQPLSTLTCLLEVNLLLPRPAQQSQHDLEIALKQVNSIVWLFRSLRELEEAGNAHQDQQVLSLAGWLREVVADLRPVAESAKVGLFLACSSECRVNFQASRLRQALFHLTEFALDSSAPGAEVQVAASEEDEEARVTVAISAVKLSEIGVSGSNTPASGGTVESTKAKDGDLKRRLGLAIARRIFERASGTLRTEDEGKRLRLEVRLPLASCPQ